MSAKEILGDNPTNVELVKLRKDLATYFEGLSVSTIENIIRDFRESILKDWSILSVKKTI